MEDSESVLLRSEKSMEGEMKATLRRLLEDPACRRMLRCWFIADWPWIWATGVVGSRPSCHGNRSHFSQVQGCCDCLYVGCSYFDFFLFRGEGGASKLTICSPLIALTKSKSKVFASYDYYSSHFPVSCTISLLPVT